ncbi:MAG TPA: hypothetical protein VFD48_06670, partial [Pyrinomonadaceae bacterium]|nr:hypothetical protein [Pyrinomonadaceae bacterium]
RIHPLVHHRPEIKGIPFVNDTTNSVKDYLALSPFYFFRRHSTKQPNVGLSAAARDQHSS